MRHLIRAAIVLAAIAAPALTSAQSGNPATGGTPPTREQAQARRDAMRERREQLKAMTPEERQALRSQMRERREQRGAAGTRERRGPRLENMTPAQQQFMRDMSAYRTSLREKSRELRGQVQAGTLTRDQMAQQLKAFRDANRPARPAATQPPSSGN